MATLKRNLPVIILAATVVFMVVTFAFNLGKFKPPGGRIEIVLDQQTKIENYIKVDAQPVRIVPYKFIIFDIRIESFQNPDALKLDPMEVCLLEDDEGNPYTPREWELTSQGDYHKAGRLTFVYPYDVPSRITLYFFDMDEMAFTWTIDQSDSPQTTEEQATQNSEE